MIFSKPSVGSLLRGAYRGRVQLFRIHLVEGGQVYGVKWWEDSPPRHIDEAHLLRTDSVALRLCGFEVAEL